MTADELIHLHGVPVLKCGAGAVVLRDEDEATDVIGEALGHGAEVVAVPVERLSDDFFTLRTGVAGRVTQKFVTYGLRLVVVGDIQRHVERSSALRDYVRESNGGRHVWFVATLDELADRLAPRPAG